MYHIYHIFTIQVALLLIPLPPSSRKRKKKYLRMILMYHGPLAGALDAERRKSNKNKNITTENMFVHEIVFSFGFAPYFACAKL